MSVPDFLTSTDYAQICDSLPDPTFILSESGRYIAILGGKDKRYYHDGSSLVGKYLQDVLVPTKTSWFLEQIRKAIDSQQMLVVEYELSSRDVLGLPPEGPEEVIIFEGRISPLKHAVHGEAAVVWVASNMTASKNLQNQLLQQAMSDELTGLCNRRHFMQSLARAYSDFIARKVPSICLLSVDVDHFKAINDQQGHVAGDQALRDLAQALLQMAGPEDLVCRVGGDEFAILCHTSMVEMPAFAQQLLELGSQALRPYATRSSTPALSLGMAQFDRSDTSMEDIIQRAAQALYVSKKQGGHRISASAQSWH